MILKREGPKPLYQQLEEIIREKIENEEWKPNTAIPSENELSKMFGVSRMTVRSVITQFVREGKLYRVQGKGTFVSEPKITTSSLSYMGIREQLERMGYQTKTKLLDVRIIPCNERVAKKLELVQNTEVYLIERLRYIKDVPLSIHISYIPAQYCKNIEKTDLVGEQLCVILDKEYGLKRKKVIETLESTSATEKEAELLDVKPRFPLLMLEDIIYDSKGIPFEYTKVLFRGDKIKIKFQYEN